MTSEPKASLSTWLVLGLAVGLVGYGAYDHLLRDDPAANTEATVAKAPAPAPAAQKPDQTKVLEAPARTYAAFDRQVQLPALDEPGADPHPLSHVEDIFGEDPEREAALQEYYDYVAEIDAQIESADIGDAADEPELSEEELIALDDAERAREMAEYDNYMADLEEQYDERRFFGGDPTKPQLSIQ